MSSGGKTIDDIGRGTHKPLCRNHSTAKCPKKGLLTRLTMVKPPAKSHPPINRITIQMWHEEHIQNPWFHLGKQSNQSLLNMWQQQRQQVWPFPGTKVNQLRPLAKEWRSEEKKKQQTKNNQKHKKTLDYNRHLFVFTHWAVKLNCLTILQLTVYFTSYLWRLNWKKQQVHVVLTFHKHVTQVLSSS